MPRAAGAVVYRGSHMKSALYILVASTIASGFGALAAQGPAPRVTLTRLDCGTIHANDLNVFSDTDAYVGKSRTLAASCYLIRHGDDLMLWDAGLPEAVKGAPNDTKQPLSPSLTTTLVEQLGRLGVRADQIGRLGISHYHFDHIGQAVRFPGATLLIGAGDWAALSSTPPAEGVDPAPLRHWVAGGGKVEPVQGDRDVFGDGTVRMIDLPGHTPGHHALLVKVGSGRQYLLSGDIANFAANYTSNGVPSFNTDRADTLASLARFKDLAKTSKATVIIQHEPADIAKLPAFPQAAE